MGLTCKWSLSTPRKRRSSNDVSLVRLARVRPDDRHVHTRVDGGRSEVEEGGIQLDPNLEGAHRNREGHSDSRRGVLRTIAMVKFAEFSQAAGVAQLGP